MQHRRAVSMLVALVGLGGCSGTVYNMPQSASDEAIYAKLYPYFTEFCALSEIRKKKDFGVPVEGGGPGGHSILYLNGVCRVPRSEYPIIALCGDEGPMTGRGVGLSVNAHYKNVNWVATPGRDFLFHGDLAPGEALTPASYARTQAKAKDLGILEGVEFHGDALANKPAGMSERDYMYEISAATDYATGFGRDRYCQRVPLSREQMAAVISYLNALNEPYRRREREFEWNVLSNNCAHVEHNALASIGLWDEWPTDRFILISAFDFPVPKNEFVNLARRANDMPINDLSALYRDGAARNLLLQKGLIATQPGSLAEAERAVPRNDLYDTDLRLIFYDEPIFGHYQQHFDEIFTEPRYTDLRANLAHFSALYDKLEQDRRPLRSFPEANGPSGAAFASLYRRYYQHVATEKAKIDRERAALPSRLASR